VGRLDGAVLTVLTIGSMCSGYGGLDLAVAAHHGARVAWHAEVDRHANAVLAHHWPGVPNLGDLTRTDWATVGPVDILTAGYPCQPFSTAGHRRGTDDPRHLWPHIADAVRHLRPRRIVLENVAGHLGLGFAQVLADLAALGFDARWGVVRAADAGAPHRRERLFVVADAHGQLLNRPRPERTAGRSKPADGRLLPTPTVVDQGNNKTPAEWDEWRDRMRTRHGNGNGHGPSLSIEAHRLGPYQPALDRWADVTGRPAPKPLQDRGDARPRLNPAFVEWMMGLDEGWVTAVPGIPHGAQLKLLGNGVVPHQAALALDLLDRP
jgi:DNA (cytosine-5)-methyltransferase 1